MAFGAAKRVLTTPIGALRRTARLRRKGIFSKSVGQMRTRAVAAEQAAEQARKQTVAAQVGGRRRLKAGLVGGAVLGAGGTGAAVHGLSQRRRALYNTGMVEPPEVAKRRRFERARRAR